MAPQVPPRFPKPEVRGQPGQADNEKDRTQLGVGQLPDGNCFVSVFLFFKLKIYIYFSVYV